MSDPSADADLADRIRAAITACPDLTLDELKAQLQTSLSRTTLYRALQRLRLSWKEKS